MCQSGMRWCSAAGILRRLLGDWSVMVVIVVVAYQLLKKQKDDVVKSL